MVKLPGYGYRIMIWGKKQFDHFPIELTSVSKWRIAAPPQGERGMESGFPIKIQGCGAPNRFSKFGIFSMLFS
jgi:hypothetical protein